MWLPIFFQEKLMLKQQIEVLIRENTILKRAVAIQHERKKEFDIKNHEMQHLKQLATQYQQQLRTLEVIFVLLLNIHPVSVIIYALSEQRGHGDA